MATQIRPYIDNIRQVQLVLDRGHDGQHGAKRADREKRGWVEVLQEKCLNRGVYVCVKLISISSNVQ